MWTQNRHILLIGAAGCHCGHKLGTVFGAAGCGAQRMLVSEGYQSSHPTILNFACYIGSVAHASFARSIMW